MLVASPDPVLSAEGTEPVDSIAGGFRRYVAEVRRFENPPPRPGEPVEAAVTILRLKSGG